MRPSRPPQTEALGLTADQLQVRIAASIMITIVQATSIWNIGVMTSAAQNLLSRGFLEKQFGADQALAWIN
ncbi:anion permease [Azorhizophilus paspali]|uniref:Anion permease n=1 Tax=Azorhizophilus paspali TaxID=69963 RepID=A0ABV6SFG8_AZOPA